MPPAIGPGFGAPIGDGIITTPNYSPPNPMEPGTPANVALYDGFFGVQSELFRNFDLAGSVSPTQTLYFGGRFKADLDIGSDGRTVPQFYCPAAVSQPHRRRRPVRRYRP